MIVCHCARVTDRDIHAAIESGATSISAIVRATGAGRCCAPCRDEIRSILGSAASGRPGESGAAGASL